MVDDPLPFAGHDKRAPPEGPFGGTCLSGPQENVTFRVPLQRARRADLPFGCHVHNFRRDLVNVQRSTTALLVLADRRQRVPPHPVAAGADSDPQ